MSDVNNQPAFPALDMYTTDGSGTLALRYEGLTKREYFAGLAMQAYMTAAITVGGNAHEKIIAEYAVKYSDALLLELSKSAQ